MSAIWDGDTGHVTITAVKDGAPVNLTGATAIVAIARNVEAPFTVSTLDEATGSDEANGIYVAAGGDLGVGTYDLVLRVTDASGTTTYPSADKGPETLVVYADLDAV